MGGVEVPQAPRGIGRGEGASPPYWGKSLGKGMCPLPRKFFVFLLNIHVPYFDAFWHVYLLKRTPMEGVLNPSNPLLGTPL